MDKFYITLEDKEIKYLMERDKRLARLISDLGDIECNYHENGFGFVVEQIVGQMLSNKAAASICNRLRDLCQNEILPCRILDLSIDDMRSIGISSAKAQYIKNFADLIDAGEFNLSDIESMTDQEAVKNLTRIRGIGDWTAKMYLLFVLRRPDVLPFEDVAFLQAYKWLYKTEDIGKGSVIKRCKKWKPYSSYAARYLYRALDCGMSKKPFHLYKT